MDEREARAEAAAAKAHAKALRPWYKKKRYVLPLAFGVVVLVAAGMAGGDEEPSKEPTEETSGVRSESQNETNPPASDVKLESCTKAEFGDYPKAGGTIHNNSSEPSNYTIHVDFNSGGRRVADGTAFESEVQPGQDVNWETTGLSEAPGQVECAVTRVERFAS